MTQVPNSDRSELKTVIQQVKKELREQNQRMLVTRKEVVIRLGKAFERETSDPEWICEEIKNSLKNEILVKLISNRDIERYSLPNWKKKTKPRKEKMNDNLSFSKEEKQPVMVTTTDGRTIFENQNDSEINKKKPIIFDTEYEEVDLGDGEPVYAEESPQNKSKLIGNDHLDFEFSLQYDKVQKYMENQFKDHNGTKPIWFHVRLNKFTGIIMSADLGRISDQY